ncbi:MAG: 30S ribosomal protein S13 [Candidatus Kerfeldbacteria bacterium]|nr:30S ribosomal protein S13 [Candidatus Kerfeldbacteria bacterium]
MPVLRLAGINLPAKKRIQVALTYLYGIGPSLAGRIITAAKIAGNPRVEELNETQVGKLRELIDKHQVEGDLKREVLLNIKRLKEIGAYRGIRHSKNLPVRGQRTRTNSRTVRGNVRRTMGSGRRAPAEKT